MKRSAPVLTEKLVTGAAEELSKLLISHACFKNKKWGKVVEETNKLIECLIAYGTYLCRTNTAMAENHERVDESTVSSTNVDIRIVEAASNRSVYTVNVSNATSPILIVL